MNLYIVRHGETDWNKQGKLQGSVDVPLNESGIALAELTAEGLRKEGVDFERIFTSPYIRARKTAEILRGDHDTPIVADEDIREMSFGSYEGVLIRELRTNPEYERFSKCFDDPACYEPEGEAEGYGQVLARVERFLKEQIMPLEGQCENVLVVCHGVVLRAFISIINKMPLEKFWTIRQPNCSVNLAKVHGGQVEMLEINRLYYDFQENARRGFV